MKSRFEGKHSKYYLHISRIENMRLITISILLFNCLTVAGQTFGSIYIDFPQKYAEKDINKQIAIGQKKKSISFSSKNKSGDTLVYTVRNNVECFTTKLTFNFENKLLAENDCDYQEYIFDCPSCAQQHLKEMINTYKFRQKTDHIFLSSYFNKVEMTVQYTSERKDHLILIFRRIDLPKREYKELYRKLKKNSTL